MKEKIIKNFLFLCAAVGIISVIIMVTFIFIQGLPFFDSYSVTAFLRGNRWDPERSYFGILPFIFGSVLVTMGAVTMALPIGIASALALSEYSSYKIASKIRPVIELLAGIPSVIYGFFGMMVIVPWLRNILGGSGYSLFAASIILSIMLLPTLINITEDALKSVPKEFREGSLALGATKWQTIKYIIIPTAKSGIWTAIILGIGRAIGETMAVIMVAGNSTNLPRSILVPGRTLTGNIALEMAYASGVHQKSLFATGIVLLFFMIIINIFMTFKRRGVVRG
jgi:phosphate transport system permease protein